MNRVYVTGVTGQVGGELKRLCPDVVCLTRNDINLSSEESIHSYFKDKNPSLIVNCAAYTKVDLAETEEGIARQVNAHAPSILAGFSDKFIHLSTDYVFDGDGHCPYSEDHVTSPLGVYGRTKLLGEEMVLRVNPNATIIRTSWIYSDLGKNFLKTILKLGKEREVLNIVSDQIGTPTYARDLASLIVENGIKHWRFKSGIYHFSNEGVASWYDFAHEIIDLMQVNCKVYPINTSDYPTPAKRPHYSVLDKTKIKKDLNIVIPHWKTSLKQCLMTLETINNS